MDALSRRRLRLAAIAGAAHLVAQVASYAVAFAVGPGAAVRENGGVSLYRVAEWLTFPVVWLAERYAASLPPLGLFYLAANSAVWAAAAWGILTLLRVPRQP